jgi:hypothetical protein
VMETNRATGGAGSNVASVTVQLSAIGNSRRARIRADD